jgi:hypothetical protein
VRSLPAESARAPMTRWDLLNLKNRHQQKSSAGANYDRSGNNVEALLSKELGLAGQHTCRAGFRQPPECKKKANNHKVTSLWNLRILIAISEKVLA